MDEALKLALAKNPRLNVDLFMGKLIGNEPFWAKLQPFLLGRGYKLRSRYQPDWTPSWRNNKGPLSNLSAFEDALTLDRRNLLDGVRVRDGTKVVFKCVPTSTEEIPVARFLTSPSLMSDPRNRSVPILDIILLPDDDSQALIVMPLLLHFNRLPFRRVGEFAEAMRQYLQGLEFMHEHNVAHRDACYFNLMMDASKLIPKGFHYIKPYTHDGVTFDYKMEWRERWAVKPNHYYFIDFGLSSRYPANVKNIKDTGIIGQDKSVPECSLTVPYNPFKMDVYQLGNAMLDVIKVEYDGLEPFLPLVQALTRQNPDDRPSPSVALNELKRINWWTLRRRVWRREDGPLYRFLVKFCCVTLD
ncbi:hypothetical protein Hypma_002169 [Hypsizygus marmoreus]|uniref:Protein kinase domain-containing protein n=1 Tax=Hypsizygus marmoreus TaxID=39966 RepID=A0A369K813_HYPMA|nr:hypothetical protein Hypma_002169 [Hypsizygus marmoreus]